MTEIYNTIKLEFDNGVAILTLNRPEKLNSFNQEMFREIRVAFKQIMQENGVRCLLITGAGRAFCAGQDLADRSIKAGDEPADLSRSLEENYNPLIRKITQLEMPVICAVNGVAAGAGSSFALACDIVFAARSASFIQSFCKLGVIPDSGGSWLLPQLAGRARAMGLAMLGEKLSADQAQQWGLIWQCIDDDKLMSEATSTARFLATQPTKGLALIKRAIIASASNSLHKHLDLERDLQGIAGRTDDYQEGVSAFMQKRSATFTGK